MDWKSLFGKMDLKSLLHGILSVGVMAHLMQWWYFLSFRMDLLFTQGAYHVCLDASGSFVCGAILVSVALSPDQKV